MPRENPQMRQVLLLISGTCDPVLPSAPVIAFGLGERESANVNRDLKQEVGVGGAPPAAGPLDFQRYLLETASLRNETVFPLAAGFSV